MILFATESKSGNSNTIGFSKFETDNPSVWISVDQIGDFANKSVILKNDLVGFRY